MSVPWLKRLQDRAQEQEWVKGAVNYDEDLHFSTYYLRASCAPVTEPLYRGYSCLVAFYEGCNETYYLLRQECLESAAAIVARALRQPGWLPRILSEIRRRCDALAGLFPTEISPRLLARFSDTRLLSLYRRHNVRHRILYKYARLPEAMDRGVSYYTEYLLEHLRTRGLAPAACAEAFAVLSEPVVPSVLAQEILEFNDIVHYARSHPAAVPPSAAGPGRARLRLDPALLRRLDVHREKWQFLPYHGYGRREVASLESFVGRLLEQLSNSASLADCATLATRCREAGRARRQLLERLKIDPPHQALFELYPEIGAVKLYRRKAQLGNFYYLDMLLAEIARRLEVSEWTVRCMLPEEVLASLERGRLANPAIRDRLDGCAYAVADGQEHILSGRQAAELRTLFRPGPLGNGEPNVLHGVVACRGRAAGPCKIIIRADDCRSGFEKGTIVVSESTDPDLVRFLRAAGGVLTEQGGVTSHAAIICREMGIPTIIGIDGLLQRVRDGDWLEVDAFKGVVHVTQPPGRTKPHTRRSIPSPELIGAKAYNLGVVRALGFRVPDFALVDYDEAQRVAGRPQSRPCRQLVERVMAELGLCNGDRLALRSSTVAEDRHEGSCAGAYRTLLNIGREETATALRDFVRSNRHGRNGDAYRGSIIVQRMIQADCAGVCLTREERTGHRDAVIIEMTEGGNTGVTGGTLRPDRVVVDRLTGDILHDERRSARLRRGGIDIGWMVQQFLTLEASFGKPLDIEWALVARELYILQARPIVHNPIPDRGA